MEVGQRFNLREHHPEKLDHRWYRRFAEDAAFQAYEYFAGEAEERGEAKRAFLEGEVRNPDLRMNIDMRRFDEMEHRLRALKKEIVAHETHDVVKQAYRWRINEKIAEIRLVKTAAEGDMPAFRKYTSFVYGEPSPEVFAYTIDDIRRHIAEGKKSEDPAVRVAAEDLETVLPVMEVEHAYGAPEEADVAKVKEATEAMYEHALPELPKGPYDATAIKSAFEQALVALGIHEWKVEVVKNGTAINASQETRTVTVPEKRVVETKRKLQQLILHELGTHVVRRESGERSKLMLLGLGLDRYEGYEEGLAKIREQTQSKAVEEHAGLEGHLAISLAWGVDGKPRDFRDVYEILERYFYFEKLRGGKLTSEEAKVKAKEAAWNRCVRTFRGTDAKTPGVCFTKDIAYREGNIAAWDVVKNGIAPEHWNLGKFDASNHRHLQVLRGLEILEDEEKLATPSVSGSDQQ